MTFAELIQTLPNGLHDAILFSIKVDYLKRTITLDLDIWTGNLESENEEEREEYKKGTLKIKDFSNCIIEPPGYVRSTKQKGIMIDAALFPHSNLEAPEKIFKNDNPKEEKYWIFLNDLNSFIFISAKKAELRWKEKKA